MSLDDVSPVAWAGLILAAVIGLLIFTIVMDIRKLPPGRFKIMPWTVLTLFMVLGLALAVRNLVLAIIAG